MRYANEDESTDPVWAILNEVPSMLAYWDSNLLCRFANRAYERWFGVKGSSLFDTSLQDLLGPELFAANEPFIRAALRGVPQEFERVVPHPDGTLRPSLARYLPHVVNGKVLGFVVEVTEVTSLHEAREQLRRHVEDLERTNALLSRSQEALRLAQRLGGVGSWELEVASGIVTWSEQLYEIFGLDPRMPAPTYAAHHAFYTSESWERLQGAIHRAIQFGSPYKLDLEYIHRSGRRGWLDARGNVQRDAQGLVTMLYGTAQEISVRRVARESAWQAQRIAELEQSLMTERAMNQRLKDELSTTRRS
ncbi:PAS domain-containing protein [Variovorax sp. N23]|uniref:PAS domain-containing protein n=1 Tax=Variovorax sp. N23 TaxID=2980555 RepID=UPI0021C8E10E|nr:GGDEF and EAL domain-containing protein [Variovorax sp. N23]MCU4120720.1 PAS domain-containing protein [Variovorax sp. N23]